MTNLRLDLLRMRPVVCIMKGDEMAVCMIEPAVSRNVSPTVLFHLDKLDARIAPGMFPHNAPHFPFVGRGIIDYQDLEIAPTLLGERAQRRGERFRRLVGRDKYGDQWPFGDRFRKVERSQPVIGREPIARSKRYRPNSELR